MKKSGFSLIELTLTFGIGAIAVLLIARAFGNYSASGSVPAEQVADTAVLLEATRTIQAQGRVSRTCSRAMVSGAVALNCETLLSRAFDGVFTWVRFLVVNGGLEYQQDDSGTGTFPSTTLIKRYPGVHTLEVCGHSELAGGTCLIEPTDFNGRYSATNRPNHFFRVRLFRSIQATKNDTREISQQTAFFVRNGLYSNGIYYR